MGAQRATFRHRTAQTQDCNIGVSARDSLPEAVARLARFAEACGRPYTLVGGAAIIARVFVRATKDVDLLMSCGAADALSLLKIAERCGYSWEPADEEDFEEAGLLRLWGPPSRREGLGLDLMLTSSAFDEEVVRRGTLVDVLGHPVRVATIEDLLLMKLDANRPVDLEDVIAIKDGCAATLDRTYLQSQADALGAEVRRRLDLLLGAT